MTQAEFAEKIRVAFAAPCEPVTRRYDGPLYNHTLNIHEDGDVTISSQHRDNRGWTTSDVWHGRTLEWAMGEWYDTPDDDEVDQIAALLMRVSDGHTVEWDGSNRVGALDTDASAANCKLAELVGGLNRNPLIHADYDYCYDLVDDIADAVRAGGNIETLCAEQAGRDQQDDATYIICADELRTWVEKRLTEDAEYA